MIDKERTKNPTRNSFHSSFIHNSCEIEGHLGVFQNSGVSSIHLKKKTSGPTKDIIRYENGVLHGALLPQKGDTWHDMIYTIYIMYTHYIHIKVNLLGRSGGWLSSSRYLALWCPRCTTPKFVPPKKFMFQGAVSEIQNLWPHFHGLYFPVTKSKFSFEESPKIPEMLKRTQSNTNAAVHSKLGFKDVCFALLRITDQSNRTLAHHFNLVGYPTVLRVFHPSQARATQLLFSSPWTAR